MVLQITPWFKLDLAWAASISVKAAVDNEERALKGKRWKLPTRVQTPMVSNYLPELNGTPELEADSIQYYQELIGVLRWATELG